MKRLITVEEHYHSPAITDKIRQLYEAYRRKEEIRSFLERFDLPETDREKIAHGNAEQLFHLREDV